MKPRVLWIEDGADMDSPSFAAKVLKSRKYALDIAETISEALEYIMENEYDVVIVDIRMEPGDNQEWVERFRKAHAKTKSARLGLTLLYSLLLPEEAKIPLSSIPKWIKPERFGVLSVETETELVKHLKKLGISNYRLKSALVPKSVLLDLIEEVNPQNRDYAVDQH